MTPTGASTRSARTRARSTGTARSTPAARRAPARATRVRRRRSLAAAVVLGVAALVVLAMIPFAKRAVRDFGLPLRYAPVIRQQARAKHLDPALVAGVIYAETKFDPRTSPTGAEGLTQMEPGTAEFLARRSGATTFSTADLAKPEVSIAYGAYYLRYLLDEYHGSEVLALAAYNGGETNVNRWEASARAHGHALRIAEIPFPETRDYVGRVLRAQRAYRRTYPRQLGYG